MSVTELLPDTKEVVDLQDTYCVIAFNDDITPYEMVVLAIQKSTGMSEEVAEMLTKEIHHQGEAIIIHRVSHERAEQVAEIMTEYTSGKIETRYGPITLPGIRLAIEKE